MDEVLAHDFFHTGNSIPKLLPASTLACPPSNAYLKQFVGNGLLKGQSNISNTARMESTTGLTKNMNPNNDKIDPKFIDTNRARAMLETDRNKNKFGVTPSMPNMSGRDINGNYDGLKRNDDKQNVKSTFHSVYDPNVKDGRGGSAVEKGPDVWVRKWVDYSSKYGLG